VVAPTQVILDDNAGSARDWDSREIDRTGRAAGAKGLSYVKLDGDIGCIERRGQA
jgi:succinyl-CoA synthetase beta subunit